MCNTIVHRGPDDDGFYCDREVGLGMRRLSIIDLPSGRQPVRNEDGSVWVVFNGEIYNFQELRQQLQGRGHVFTTRTDTEVIVHLYEEYGRRCVEHLRGMFAFALWDSRQKQLLLARDRIGIKPLYFAESDGRILFASELKSILQMPEIQRNLNWSSVSHLFTFLTTPPAESIIEGVHKLEPGHLLTIGPGRVPLMERYWNVDFVPEYGRKEDYFVDRVRELLAESVRLHMVSDVPVGAFLSGGIDSSAVVAMASMLSPDALNTFTIGFNEPDYNELGHAGLVASEFGTDHHELTLGPGALGDQMQDLAWHLDEPFGDSSAIPTFMVSKLASQSVKVVLSGDGGDELFGGYDKYVVEQRERSTRFLPAPARNLLGKISRTMPEGMRGRNLLRHYSLPPVQRYLDALTLFRQDEMQKLFRPEISELLQPVEPWRSKAVYLESGGNWLSNLQGLDINNYLPLDILTKVDRMSMAHSIETRVPLLDHKLVEFAATIPPEMNLRGGTTKYVLKRAMKGILPERIIHRPKQGFAIPLGYWFRDKLGSYVRDLLLGERSRQRGFFNSSYVESLVARHEQGQNLDLQLWTLISFELWSRSFLDGQTGRRERTAA